MEYSDIWGQRRHAPDATKIRLLQAMGLAIQGADPARDADAALAGIEEREWLATLPPVTVVREGDASTHLTLTLPATRSSDALGWLLQLESGERTAGTLAPEALHALEARDVAGVRYDRRTCELPLLPGPGYHTFSLVEAGSGAPVASTQLIVCPARCYQPPGLDEGGRLWGPAAQLYALRSARNWGIGDLADLRSLTEFAASAGASIVGVNPLHAVFPGRPEEASPYRPSSRTRLNVLYLAVEAIADFEECPAAREHVRAPEFQARLRALRAAGLVDYTGVACAKFEVLELLYGNFRDRHLARVSARARDFREFQAAGGEALRLHALFEALQERFCREDPGVWGWPAWPEAYRDPAADAVTAFGRDHAERVEYFQYLQWQAELQLASIAERSRALGLPVGLYQDLAVGVNPGGAETWAHQGLHALEASIGAPPDEFNLNGQEWGLPPWIPQRLSACGYAPFIALLRGVMRHAGALRIDHVMGLMRLFWIPAGSGPADGTYVSYPYSDLLGLLALESQRNRCLIIGEDLGTVPDAVRAAMASLGILSYRPMYFERDDHGEFKPPGAYAREAVVAVSTHDLPTLRGYWLGADLAIRTALGLFPSGEMRAAQVAARARDRQGLLAALDRAALLPADTAAPGAIPEDMDDRLVQAVHAFVARTPAKIFSVQLEDLLGQVEQVNLPGTTDDRYPNWRRKLPSPLEAWPRAPSLSALTRVLDTERGYKSLPRPQPGPRDKDSRPTPAIIPRATYRLQFHKAFTFAQATAIVPYLAQLGLSHVYASPYLKARPGSQHGYDITDHNAFNPEIGTVEDFERYAAALRQHGMGQVIDLVPNHMAVMQADNAWWLDVLENGQASRYSGYFDIDWEPLAEELRGKVLIPILGAPYSQVLESGGLKLVLDSAAGELSINYDKHRCPVDPREYPRILGPALERLPAADPQRASLQDLAGAFARLPARTELAPEKIAERARDKEIGKRELAAVCARFPGIASLLAESIQALNGRPGEAASFDRLHELIEAQAYRLAYWRVASDDINYRRFFDINDLAALRMESASVFEDTHRLVLKLVGEGKVDALRIDHPDGLYDPPQYFERLQSRARAEMSRRPEDPGRGVRDGCISIALEKILAEHERLPEHWPVHGTTGYRFMNVVNGLFVDSAAEARMDRTYAAFIGRHINYDELLHQTKILIMTTALASELNVLANTLNRIAKAGRRNRDFTLNSLRRTLVEIVAAFPIYRTYATVDGLRSEDRRHIDWAVALARKRSSIAESGAFDFIRSILTGAAAGADAGYRELAGSFIGRFQQFTAPVMAKAMEDTSFYVYNRLVSLNEVGGDPRTFGFSLNAFHAASQDRVKTWPHTMLATSTHDNKRSEDVRARINVLSEMPAAWRLMLRRWARLNRRKKVRVAGEPAPSANDEYLLYQILLGAWPPGAVDQPGLDAFRDRIQRYMLKAVREAKTHTSWINPNEEYERALSGFVDALLKSVEPNPFLTDFLPAQKRIARHGMLNSLSQLLVKLASPGVPDFYQGNELWDFSLVDPDNRRPVDFARRAGMLHELETTFSTGKPVAAAARGLLDAIDDGRIKLYVTWKGLAARRRHPGVFENGGYLPLPATGERAEHLCAFARVHEGTAVIAVAPRLHYGLTGGNESLPLGPETWGDTHIALPEGRSKYRDEMTGVEFNAEPVDGQLSLPLADVLANFPVALLTSTGN